MSRGATASGWAGCLFGSAAAHRQNYNDTHDGDQFREVSADGSLHVYDPFDYDVQIANAVQENAFRRGA